MVLDRKLDLIGKTWGYFLDCLRMPGSIPIVIRQAGMGKAHLGELLKLLRYRRWFTSAGVRTVIDVGAHTGEFASAIAAIVPNCNIYSYEPQADCYQELLRRMSGHEGFRAFPIAVGDHSGKIEFHRSQFTKSSSILPMGELHKNVFPWTAAHEQIEVTISRLDDYRSSMELEPKVLLKLDVQGYEDRVLAGAEQVLTSTDYIIVEVSFAELYAQQASFDKIYNRLIPLGFSYQGAIDTLISPVDGAVLQADLLFRRGPRHLAQEVR